MNKAKVEEIFRIAGNVIEIELKTDKDGRSRGMCTVRYEHPMEAVQAIGTLDNVIMDLWCIDRCQIDDNGRLHFFD